jgi:hypothetical protein
MDPANELRNLLLLTIILIFSSLFTACKQNEEILSNSDPSGLSNCDSTGPENVSTTNTGITNIAPENHMSQSFITISPCIKSIEFAISTLNPGHGGGTVTAVLFKSDRSILFLAKQNVSEGFDGWLRYEMPRPLSVKVGEKLIIELEDDGDIVFGWKISNDTYADGTAIEFGNVYSNHDFLFRINQVQ